jgi:OOP family OmpA-OmpF porin
MGAPMQPRSLSLHAGAAVIAVLCSSAAPEVAHAQPAQQLGFGVDRFNPSERGSEWFALDSLDLRGSLRPAAGAVFEWAHNPLIVDDANGNQLGAIVADQVYLHVGASLVLVDRLRLGLDFPIALFENGNDATVGGTTYPAPTRASTGDLRASADVRLLGTYGDAFTAAIGASFFMPTGEPREYTGDGLARGEPHALVAGDIPAGSGLSIAYAVRLGFMIRGISQSFAGVPLGHEVDYGVSAGVRLLQRQLLLGPELYGATGITSSDAFFKKFTSPVELLVGGHYTIASDWRVGAGIGPGLSAGYGSPAFRLVASAEWTPGYVPPPPSIGDRDGDGISDDLDMCPDRPGAANGSEPLVNGCPPDRDKDGVFDSDDACPDTPGVRTNDPKTNGCPPDKDGDGIPDAQDACPDVPGVKTDDPKTNGCPPDRDHDGVADNEDACPDTPGVRTNDPKTNGCPPPDPDRDKDGIPNEQDACPDVPGEKTDDPKTNGCPKARVENGEIKINEQVKFKFDSSEILSDSDALMGAVQKILTDHPEIGTVRVEGHTDNVGKKAHNQKLSEQRAASVVAWLVKHGIDKKRLHSQGFGADKPIDSNNDEAGRKNNRRVEFHIEKAGDSAPPAPQGNKPPPPAPPKPPAPKP